MSAFGLNTEGIFHIINKSISPCLVTKKE